MARVDKKRIPVEMICMDSGLNEPAIVFTADGGMYKTSPVRSFLHTNTRGCVSIETVNSVYYVA